MSTQIYIPAQDDALFNGLKRMCVPDHHSCDSPVLRPFAVEFGGEPWVAFTEGHVLVIVRGERPGVAPYHGKHEDGLKRTLEMLTPQGGTWHRGVSFRALRDWVDVSRVGKCPVCCGTGLEPSELSDGEINERLNGVPDPRLGRLFGCYVQRAIVETAFAPLKADTVDVCIPETSAEPIVIVADEWRMMWMPLGDDDGRDLPSFPQ